MSALFSNRSETLTKRFSEIQKIVEPIQGWVSDQDGMVLYELARFHAPVSTVVELGSWKGRSTTWLGHAIKDRGEGKVFAVDTWMGTQNSGPDEETCRQLLIGYKENQLYEEFLQNMRNGGVSDIVQSLQGDSTENIQKFPHQMKIGLLFIDADHDYHAVKKDFETWSPKVATGGYVVFDDVPSWPGPTQLVSELPSWYKKIYMGINICVLQKL